MKAKHRTKRIQRYRKMLGIIVLILTITLIGVVVSATVLYKRKNACKTPDTTLVEYMMHIPKQEYEEMYAMIDLESSGYISKEDFLKRNSTIYEGIEMQNMSIKNVEYVEEDKKVTYLTSFDTVAGTISFENEAFFINGEEGYKLVWDDSMIFPNLTSADKVRVSTTQAERGEILDRNGRVLAGKGTASSVGIVPGKLENREEAIAQIAGLLEITTEVIEKNLSAKWVSDGTITLTANVVFPYSGNSKVYAHEVVVRPLEDGGVQYVSNRIIPSEDNSEETWHTPRLTLEEWEELYGGE